MPGSQLLYRDLEWEACGSPGPERPARDRRFALALALERDPEGRRFLESQLAGLSEEGFGQLPSLLWDDSPSPPVPPWVFVVLGFSLVLSLAGIGTVPELIFLAALLIVVNLLLFVYCQSRTEHLRSTLGALSRVVSVASTLSSAPLLAPRAEMLDVSIPVRRLARRAGPVALPLDPLKILETLDAVLLIGTAHFYSNCRAVDRHRSELRRLFLAVAEIDVSLSIASLRKEDATLSALEIPGPEQPLEELVVRGLRHPLVSECVPNDIEAKIGSGFLVIGSNRGGKTTFLKALGVNALLANVLGTVFADDWCGPSFEVLTAFDVVDDLESGRSLFAEEAVRLLEVLRRHEGAERPPLMLLDEIFGGTNPRERLAASIELLKRLVPGAIVGAATHDLGLCEELQSDFEIYHFKEHERAHGDSGFDYRLHLGMHYAPNALATLDALGFPEDLVAAAMCRVGASPEKS